MVLHARKIECFHMLSVGLACPRNIEDILEVVALYNDPRSTKPQTTTEAKLHQIALDKLDE